MTPQTWRRTYQPPSPGRATTARPAAQHTLKEGVMPRRCINDSCQDENGPFVPTPDGDLCEDCYEAQEAEQ